MVSTSFMSGAAAVLFFAVVVVALGVLADHAIRCAARAWRRHQDDSLEARAGVALSAHLTTQHAALATAAAVLLPHPIRTTEHALGLVPFPETKRPATWHGDGASTPLARRVHRERSGAAAMYAASSDAGRGLSFRGMRRRTPSGTLLELWCTRCGRDLLTIAGDPWRTVCPCSEARPLRRLS